MITNERCAIFTRKPRKVVGQRRLRQLSRSFPQSYLNGCAAAQTASPTRSLKQCFSYSLDTGNRFFIVRSVCNACCYGHVGTFTLPYLTLLYLQQVWKRLASLLFCVPMGCFFPYVFVVFCFWLYFGYMCWDLGLTFFSFGGFLFGLFYSLFRHYTSIRVGSVCLVCLYVFALSFLSSLSFFTFLGGIFVKMFACIQLVYFHGSLVYCHFHLTGFVVFSFCHLQFMPTYYTCSL